MPRILITGSSDGLGLQVAQRLVSRGHDVVLHARNEQRARDATSACPGAQGVVTGDLSSLAQTKQLAASINQLGGLDTLILNAGLYRGDFRKTEDGIPALVAVNTIAPYVLAALVRPVPKRIVFLSSGLHQSGSLDLGDLLWKRRGEAKWNDMTAYCDSKLCNILLAKAFARRWPNVSVNALDPGWMPTKMGGAGATGSFESSIESYVLLAEGEGDECGEVTGRYWHPSKKEGKAVGGCEDEEKQEELLKRCREFSGVDIE
ncbi:hypothetical protein B0J11DRAFT_147548 [Dendryphion nanum]|uniref:Short chain dehydrogenase n=1 Tax=Dendryphion nanum TaxID=256645 RepID=A0A9P9IVB7_9PLEO|nr:hypothetical protein B0J11DRAFT_147548 [Dendryphion nanum]